MDNAWEIVYRGDLIAVEKHATKGYERAVRPPGIRLLLRNAEGKLMLTKEFRAEQGKVDYRLPGGKVLDDLVSYLEVRGDEARLHDAVMKAAVLEAKQEAGVDEIKHLEVVARSVAGASVEWDLYYVCGDIGSMSNQELDGDEKMHGIEIGFYSNDEVLEMLKRGEISEDRTAGVLFRYLFQS